VLCWAANSIARPQDIAQIVAFAVSLPRSVSLNEILVRPTGQAF
jgi:NADP-dependent 3-hydroxy acid dehydrogenase YdfG